MKNHDLLPIVIINSGAYSAQELFAEFGALPPSFLPVGLGRLYELQVKALKMIQAEMFLTVPESFDVPAWDAERLSELNFTVIRTPDDLSLGSAVLYALGKIGFQKRPLKILHGDTLVSGIDLSLDNITAVAKGGDSYRWAQVEVTSHGTIDTVSPPNKALDPDHQLRLCGYFAFESASRFAEKLVIANGDFFAALNLQSKDVPLSAITPERWLDFGHVQTFFRSRRIVTTERSFNSLQIGEMHVRKRSTLASNKLKAEARWLREAPAPIAPFCARILNEGEDAESYYYDSEYEYMPTLAELYVLGRVALPAWSRILGSCASFIEAATHEVPKISDDNILQRLVIDKTAERLEEFANKTNIDLNASNELNGRPAPSLWECLKDIRSIIIDCGEAPSIMHGDFCFSNILYSFRTDRIRVIDPRGLTLDGDFSLYGDRRYDLAKLMHSICGRYDVIVSGQYAGGRTGAQSFELSFPSEPWRLQIEAAAKSLTMGGIPLASKAVWAAMTSLFLSMPPLHADRPDRQNAFIANALRLHMDLENAL